MKAWRSIYSEWRDVLLLSERRRRYLYCLLNLVVLLYIAKKGERLCNPIKSWAYHPPSLLGDIHSVQSSMESRTRDTSH